MVDKPCPNPLHAVIYLRKQKPRRVTIRIREVKRLTWARLVTTEVVTAYTAQKNGNWGWHNCREPSSQSPGSLAGRDRVK